ncbi:hypothetical protein COOONC_25033 [Cooperia oncophora]
MLEVDGRQFYLYATDPLVKRIGMQCWVYCAVTALEAAICVKFGRHMFPDMPVYPINSVDSIPCE